MSSLHLMRFLPRSFAASSGQTLIVVAVSLAALLGFVGFATDVGVMLHQKRLAQTAADAAAMAGASQLSPIAGQNCLTSGITTAGQQAATQNGFTNGVNGTTVSINDAPTLGPNSGTCGYVQAIITQSSSVFFARLFGPNTMSVSARAVATLGNSQNCIYALGSSGVTINASNAAKLTAANCGVVGNGNLSVVGSANITAQSIAIAGTSTINNGGSTSPAPVTGVAPSGDPLSYLTPPTFNTSSCVNPPAGGNGSYAKNVTLGPAISGGTVCYNYLNIANGATGITLTPGLYIINGSFTLGGGVSVTGNGVTFYFPSNGDQINIANGVTDTLSAPTTGTYAGILFYQNPADTSAVQLEGGANSNLQGVIYAPSAPLLVENGTGTKTYVDIVSNSLTIDGGISLKNYDQLAGAPDPIKAVRLVE